MLKYQERRQREEEIKKYERQRLEAMIREIEKPQLAISNKMLVCEEFGIL